ncbi:MAG: VPLPA-CTERM-specific exosortase XrtD [Desulfobacteraceae bacterium]|jgi:exosortase D (VPLPA-CTERM-specific)
MSESKKNRLVDIRPAALFSLLMLIISFVLLYKTDFDNILIRWGQGDLSYCYLVPVIFLYLLYLKADVFRAFEQKPSSSGIVLLVSSAIIYFCGRQGSLETLTYISIWLSLIALFLILFGKDIARNLAFPFVILGFIVPVPPFLNNLFTFKLKLISSYLAVKIMQLIGLSVFREGNIIDMGITQLQVVDACSGLRYVYPLLLMGFIFAYMFNKKWWERLVVILSTIPISIVTNSLRIAVTGYLTIKVSPDAAEGFFHDFEGWLIFMVSFVMLAIFSYLMKALSKKIHGDIPADNVYPVSDSAVINLKNTKISCIWISIVLFFSLWGVNHLFTSSQFTPERRSFETFPLTIDEWEGRKSYINPEIMKELWADDYIQASFQNKNTGDYLLFFVPYYEYQKNRHTAHAPAACLVGSGYAPLSKKTIKRKFPSPFGDVEIGQLVLEKRGQRLLSNFWFHGRGRVVASEYLNKWYLFYDSVTKHRTDGALVRIEMPINKGQSVEEAQKIVDDFTLKVLEILPRYVPE